MTRENARRALFKHSDVVRAIKAAKASDTPVKACRIEPDGALVLVFSLDHAEAPAPAPDLNEWDEVLR